MRLVLTRAAEDAAQTREKLEAMGHRVVLSPVIEIVPTDAAWPVGVVDAVVATSAHAFCAAFGELLPETRRLMPLYLVGSRTMEAARRADFLGAATVEKNAAALASILRNMGHRPHRIVVLAGRDRKPDLESALRDMGQAFDVVEVYSARGIETASAEAQKAFGLGIVDGVLHFSRRSATLFIEAAQKAGLELGRPTHFCLSEDVAAPLREADFPKIAVAAEPNEADLLSRIGQA